MGGGRQNKQSMRAHPSLTDIFSARIDDGSLPLLPLLLPSHQLFRFFSSPSLSIYLSLYPHPYL